MRSSPPSSRLACRPHRRPSACRSSKQMSILNRRNVLELFGKLRRGQWLPSYFAKSLLTCLDTVQVQPITIGGEQLSFEGQYLPKLTPTGLKAVLSAPKDLQATLQSLRDDTLSKLNA